MQKYFDCHLHSFNSLDSEQTFEQILSSAERENLAGIIVTDHYEPCTTCAEHRSKFSDVEHYYKNLTQLQCDYNGDLKILRGVELGYVEEAADKLDEALEKFDWDCVLGSIHQIDGDDPHRPGFFDDKSRAHIYPRYIELMIRMVEDYGKFHVVTHFDMPSTMLAYENPKILYKESPDLFDALFKAIIKRNIAFEVNTKSIKFLETAGEECGIDKEILYRYRELGGELITLGSDSHNKPGRGWDNVGHKIYETAQLLKSCGFSAVMHFEKGQPIQTSI